jgi:ribonuclease P protein component
MKRLTFPKSARLLNNGQFRRVLARKVAASDSLLTLFVAENDCGHPRLGVSIGRTASNAVNRNRLKRLIREAYRLNQQQIPQGRDFVVMPSPRFLRLLKSQIGKEAFKKITLEEVERSFLALAKEIGQSGRLGVE